MQSEKLLTISKEEFLGPLIIFKKSFSDHRGIFFESWNKNEFNNLLNENVDFVQDNHSISKLGVLRGLHYQLNPYAQGKLVRCIKGKIFDVIVDLRQDSPTFGKWGGIELSSVNLLQLWIPIGFAHGFLTLTEKAEIIYKTTNFWNKSSERGLRWDDPEISIHWPIVNQNFLLSEKDKNAPFLKNITKENLFK